MSLDTTVAKLGTCVEAVSGVQNVRIIPTYPVDLSDADLTLLTDDGEIQRWTFHYVVRATHAGVTAGHVELDVQLVALWGYRENDALDSHREFQTILEAALLRLMDPTNGFPQIDENGIQPADVPEEPVAAETGHGVHRARYTFHLLDVTST